MSTSRPPRRCAALGFAVYPRTYRRLAAVAALGTVAAFAFAPGVVSAAPPSTSDKVSICHRTNSTTNPYVSITVAVSAVDGVNGKGEGKGDHYANHTGPVWSVGLPNGGEWGDIIPPVPGVHGGRNWDAAGKAIWAAGCHVGAVHAVLGPDSDADGVLDHVDGDDDNDGVADHVDLDDDGDGAPDGTDHSHDEDSDGVPDGVDHDDDADGVPDHLDPTHDSDVDTVPDRLDLDDDNDGVADEVDGDDDGDTTPDLTDPDADLDGDGRPNATDLDNDGDSIPDWAEPDFDGDGRPNPVDADDDGDSIPDSVDSDRDGDNVADDSTNPDSDFDGVPDSTDSDDDNDTVTDRRDRDANGDGLREDEAQVVAELRTTGDVKPGKPTRFGTPGARTDMGVAVNYTVTCGKKTGVSVQGGLTGKPAPTCVVKYGDGTAQVTVLTLKPITVKVSASSAAVGNSRGFHRSYVFHLNQRSR